MIHRHKIGPVLRVQMLCYIQYNVKIKQAPTQPDCSDVFIVIDIKRKLDATIFIQ